MIKYASSGGGLGTFVAGTLPGTSQGYISNNVGNSSVDLVVTNGPAPVPVLTWDGVASGDWDTSTANWVPHSGASAGSPVSGPDTTYGQGSYVTFDDTLAGTNMVNLATVLTPINLAVNNSATNYTFVGTGKISGSSGLAKTGTGTLTLAETGGDNFSGGITVNNGSLILATDASAVSGGVTISGGTLQVGNGGTSGVLPAIPVADNSALAFNRSNNVNVANVVNGTGTLTQNGTGILSLSGSNNAFAGAITVAQGTLQAGNTNVLGVATGVTVSSGATLDVNGQALYASGAVPPVSVSGAGVGGNGAIVNNGASQSKVLHTVTLAADAIFGGSGDWDIRNSSGSSAPADAQLNGAFNLTKAGTNTVTLNSVTVDPALANINVLAGTLSVANLTTSLGNTSSNLTVFTNATLQLSKLTNVLSKVLVLNNSATLQGLGTNTFGGPVVLAGGTATVVVGSGAQLTLTNAISGLGGLSKNGSSTLFLTAGNTFSGGIAVSAGTLALAGLGSISNSPTISVGSGATFDVSAVGGGFALGAAQKLSGYGAVNGAVSANGTIAPGAANSIGTLTLSNAPTLNGVVLIKLNSTNGQSSDNLTLASGTLTYGGTLTATNTGSVPTNGAVFTLFSAPAYGGAFATLNLPVGGGAHWKTNNLASSGTIIFSNTAPVAGSNFTLGVTVGTPSTVQIVGGKYAPTDADGDTLAITGVSGETNGHCDDRRH